MKVSEIKQICRDFTEARKPDGKLTCLHKLSEDLCKLPDHFLCEVVAKSRTPVRYISVSRIKLWEECQRKWALHYHYRIEPTEKPKWKSVGSAFALNRAKIDQGQPWEIPADVTDPVDIVRLRAILRGYERLPRLATSNEVQLSREIPGVQGLYLMGYLDGISDKTIYEWKYTADPSSYDTLSMQMQGGSYFWLAPEATTLMLCIVRKPSRYKPKKDESIEDFEKRLNDEIEADPNHWFIFQQFLRGEFNTDLIIDQLERRFREIAEATTKPLASEFMPNYSACENFGGCDYKAFCRTHTGSGIGCKKPGCTHPDICSAINKVSF